MLYFIKSMSLQNIFFIERLKLTASVAKSKHSIICSKLKMETPEQMVKCSQSFKKDFSGPLPLFKS